MVAVARRYWGANGPNWAAAVGLRLLLALRGLAEARAKILNDEPPKENA